MSASTRSEPDLRQDVITAVLYLTYAQEAYLGRLTAAESFSLGHAHDRLDDALTAYVAHAAEVRPATAAETSGARR